MTSSDGPRISANAHTHLEPRISCDHARLLPKTWLPCLWSRIRFTWGGRPRTGGGLHCAPMTIPFWAPDQGFALIAAPWHAQERVGTGLRQDQVSHRLIREGTALCRPLDAINHLCPTHSTEACSEALTQEAGDGMRRVGFTRPPGNDTLGQGRFGRETSPHLGEIPRNGRSRRRGIRRSILHSAMIAGEMVSGMLTIGTPRSGYPSAVMEWSGEIKEWICRHLCQRSRPREGDWPEGPLES
jgi:hypothetical protein